MNNLLEEILTGIQQKPKKPSSMSNNNNSKTKMKNLITEENEKKI